MIVPILKVQFTWICEQYVIKSIFLMIKFQVNQLCRFQQK
jgi:hypothetical protein